jgi:antiviral helicase SKI2
MTTEILLQMLYNSSEVISELEWVIFDEVHYCNDPERGHVWEKVFILLPDHISLVLLSATVANIPEYADWLGRTRNKKTFVISTTKRPVPLEHFIYIGKGSSGKEEKFQFIDAESKLLDQGYRDALTAMKEKESNFVKKFGPKSNNPQSERNFYIGMILIY